MAKVGIIGGACSGVLAALALSPEFEVIIFETSETLGKGVAYGTSDPIHLLNVPAIRMSAIADKPSHFAEWISKNHNENNPTAYVPRMWYGDYLADSLASSRAVTHIRESVVNFAPSTGDSKAVVTNKNNTYSFDFLILALGIPKSEWPVKVPDSQFAFSDPWEKGVVEKILTLPSVTFLGSGLTTVDLLLSLTSRGYKGEINILSRHGLMPLAHFSESATDVTYDNTNNSLVGIFSWLRKHSNNGRWDKVIDSLRPHTQDLWRGLSDSDKNRFLRHLKSFWEIHRHRMAPEVGRRINELNNHGRFKIHAGKFLDWEPDTNKLTFRPRGKSCAQNLTAHAFVNCTGFAPMRPNNISPILKSALKEGYITLDKSGLGIDPQSRVLADPNSRIDVIGALRRAELFETTAVPSLAPQAKAISERISCLAL